MSDEEFSPPTSPVNLASPPTSPPVCELSSDSANLSSATDSLTDSSPSPNSSPGNRKRKRKAWRSTIQRKIQRQNQQDGENDSCSESVHEDQDVNEVVAADQHAVPRAGDHEDHGRGRIPSPPVLLAGDRDDNSDDNLSQSNSDTSDSSATSHDSSRVSSAHSSIRGSEDGSVISEASSSEPEDDAELYEGSNISANAGLLKVLQLYVEERMTKESLHKNIQLIKSLLPQPNELPSSGKAALKKLEKLTSTCSETEYLYCEKCWKLIEEENEVDNSDEDSLSDSSGRDDQSCKHDGSHGKFYSFPIDEQVKHMFEQRALASAIVSYQEHRTVVPGHLCDIVDSAQYKIVKVNLPGKFDLILLWNSDGVALSSSSNQELWIILCTICEVPPRLRSSYVIVAGVVVGGKAPDMNVFLKPFAESLKNLFQTGFQWVHPESKEAHVSKVAAPVFSGDAPAKSYVLKCKNHNYKYGCLVCEQKTKRIRLPVQNANDPDETPRHVRRFVFQDDIAPAPLRTGPRMDMLGEIARRRKKPRKGVIDRSVVSEIPHLDRAVCCSAEYMHLVLLGVVKYFLLIIFTKAGRGSLTKKLEEINEFVMNDIKVPDFISRLPRKVKDLKYWKASELRAFLLFYSLPLFKKFQFPDEYFQHWLLLVSAIHILLKDAISDDDLNCAEVMLRDFVRDVGILYGQSCYTYNVHNLLHVCLLVRRWGPLWATSAFPFETFNGFLGSNVHGTKHLGVELIKNIKIAQSVVILENIVKNAPHHHPAAHFNLSQALGKAIKKDILTHDELGAIESSLLGEYALHVRAKSQSNIYTSRLYDLNKKRANSFIQFNSPDSRFKFGEIIVFIKAENETLHCLVDVFKISQVDLFLHRQSRYVVKHLLPVVKCNTLVVIPIDSIQTKVLIIGNYIGLRPNTYEVNL